MGYRRQKDLAAAVGCSEDQMSRWAQAQLPPNRITRGYDVALARALETTHDVLFDRWLSIAPEDAERVAFHPDQFFGKSKDEPLLMTDIDHVLMEVSRRLWQGEVEQVLEYAVKLVLARNDERAAEFREIAERFKMFDERGTVRESRAGYRLEPPPRKRMQKPKGS